MENPGSWMWDMGMRHKLPIVTIVLNNAEWGMSRNAQNLLYGKNREVIVALQDTRYETVARGFGAGTLGARRRRTGG